MQLGSLEKKLFANPCLLLNISLAVLSCLDKT
jgi:hypothetical protein